MSLDLDDPWGRLAPLIGDRTDQTRLARSAGLFDAIMTAFAAPRDLDDVADYLARSDLRGDILIHGAGAHSRLLAEILDRSGHLRVAAYIDRRAEALGIFQGRAVISPAQAAARDEPILLSHTCRENDMRYGLHAAGVAPNRIHAIYTDPRYIDAAYRRMRDALQPDQLGHKPYVVIRAGRSREIESDALIDVFPPRQTATFFIGREDYREHDPNYPTVDLKQSLWLLRDALAAVKPRVIYLSTGWFNNFLSMVVPHLAPQAFYIHELFDLNLLFPGAAMSVQNGLEQTTRDWNFQGEWTAAQTARAIVSKRGGALWERCEAHIQGASLPYFHDAAVPGEHQPDNRNLSIIYGGMLPNPDFLATYAYDYDFIDIFEAITEPDVQFHIYNSLHESPRDDYIFEAYTNRFKRGSIQYHPRTPFAQFKRRIQDADYGWLAVVNRNELHPDQLCVFPHRATGYLTAGLPLIVDPGWTFVAERIAQANAGLVLDDLSPKAVLDALRAADRPAHRRGARDLAEQCLAQNRRTIQALRDLIV